MYPVLLCNVQERTGTVPARDAEHMRGDKGMLGTLRTRWRTQQETRLLQEQMYGVCRSKRCCRVRCTYAKHEVATLLHPSMAIDHRIHIAMRTQSVGSKIKSSPPQSSESSIVVGVELRHCRMHAECRCDGLRHGAGVRAYAPASWYTAAAPSAPTPSWRHQVAEHRPGGTVEHPSQPSA